MDRESIGLEERVRRFVGRHSLLEGVKRLGVAVSGGSDSIALLHILCPICKDKGIEPFALNFDHGVEGEHSDEDAVFVREEAESLGIPFVGEVASGIKGGEGRSFEMAARDARHEFYLRQARTLGLDAIATGHQRDDVAETLLMRLMRGAGAAGLSALGPRSSGAWGAIVIIRPLLDVGREELRDWLKGRGIGWREDPSNANTDILRNAVRHLLIPSINNVLRRQSSLAQSSEILRDEDACLEDLASSAFDDCRVGEGLCVSRLRGEYPLAIQRRVVWKWLLENLVPDLGFRVVEETLSMVDGMSVMLPGEVVVEMSGGVLVPRDECVAPPPKALLRVGEEVGWGAYSLSAAVAAAIDRSRPAFGVWPATCTISLEKLGGRPITVRGRRKGDRFSPIGLDGSRKVQDILTDAKVPRAARDSYPVLEVDGEIAWVPGCRASRHFAVGEGETPLLLTAWRMK